MDRKVVWTDAAVDDLETAAEYISKDSPSYAAAFVLQSLESAKYLSDLAEMGWVVTEFKKEKNREIFFHYIVFIAAGFEAKLLVCE